MIWDSDATGRLICKPLCPASSIGPLVARKPSVARPLGLIVGAAVCASGFILGLLGATCSICCGVNLSLGRDLELQDLIGGVSGGSVRRPNFQQLQVGKITWVVWLIAERDQSVLSSCKSIIVVSHNRWLSVSGIP